MRALLSLLACSAAVFAAAAAPADEPSKPLAVPDVALYAQPELESAMLADLNAERRKHDLPEVTLDPALRTIARAYAREMLTKGFIGHVDPGGGTLLTRLNAAHYRFKHAAENLIYTTGDEPEAFEHLLLSPHHHANILDKAVNRVGIGAVSASVYSTMYVQEFAGD